MRSCAWRHAVTQPCSFKQSYPHKLGDHGQRPPGHGKYGLAFSSLSPSSYLLPRRGNPRLVAACTWMNWRPHSSSFLLTYNVNLRPQLRPVGAVQSISELQREPVRPGRELDICWSLAFAIMQMGCIKWDWDACRHIFLINNQMKVASACTINASPMQLAPDQILIKGSFVYRKLAAWALYLWCHCFKKEDNAKNQELFDSHNQVT